MSGKAIILIAGRTFSMLFLRLLVDFSQSQFYCISACFLPSHAAEEFLAVNVSAQQLHPCDCFASALKPIQQ
jgi:hypothetical protein